MAIAENSSNEPKYLLVDANGYLQVVNSAALPAGTAYIGKVRLTDGTTDSVIDVLSAGQVTITIPHHKIHTSVTYLVSHLFTAVADDASADLRILVHANEALHATVRAVAGGASYAYVYEGTTYDPVGTAVTAYNKNRASTNTTEALIYYTPTVNVLGTQIAVSYIAGGGGPFAVGSGIRMSTELILKKSTDYLFRVTNKSGGAVDISIEVEYYEV